MRLSKTPQAPSAALPFSVKGVSESKLPRSQVWRIPPLGASGLT